MHRSNGTAFVHERFLSLTPPSIPPIPGIPMPPIPGIGPIPGKAAAPLRTSEQRRQRFIIQTQHDTLVRYQAEVCVSLSLRVHPQQQRPLKPSNRLASVPLCTTSAAFQLVQILGSPPQHTSRHTHTYTHTHTTTSGKDTRCTRSHEPQRPSPAR